MECVRAKAVPGWSQIATSPNASSTREAIAPEVMTLFFDPQTAGGLLISIDERDAARLEQITGTGKVRRPCARGRVVEREDGKPIRLI